MSYNSKKNSKMNIESKQEKSLIKRYLYFISKALTETGRDFTTGSMKKAIVFLSIPMVLEMVMESVFAVVDIYFVGKVSPEAVAAVGITESLITIIYAIAFGLSMAAGAMVSRRIGEKDVKGAANATFQALITGFVPSMIISIIGLLFAEELLLLMGASQATAESYSGYMQLMLGGNFIIMALFIINAVFRSAGDPVISMIVLWIANILNIILDPCLIFGWGPFPELGVTGAAAATNIGRGVAVIIQIIFLFRGRSRIKLTLSELKPDIKVIFTLIKLSIGAIGQNIIATSSWIILVRIIAVFGETAVAGYTVAIRLIIFSILPSFGMSNAASTLVGQNLGALRPDRSERAVWLTAKFNLFLLGFIGLLLVFFSEFWVSLLSDDIAVISFGSECLRIISYGFLAFGPGMILMHAFLGAGDTITPTWINFISFWVIEIPLAYFLAITLDWQQQGVCYAIIIAETILTLLAMALFKRGRWKLKQV